MTIAEVDAAIREATFTGFNVSGVAGSGIIVFTDLIAQGFSGQELLAKFKELSKKIAPAMEKLISEADSIAKEEKKGASMLDIFGAED